MISFIKMRKLVILNFSFLVLSVTAVQFNSSKEYPLSNNDHLSSSLSQNHGLLCPVWFTYNNASQQCICGDDLGGVIGCDNEEQRAYVMRCYCMTYDNQTGVTVGSCFSNCFLNKSSMSFKLYFRVPMNHSDLNEVMCGERWNRDGQFCGKCKDGYYPLVYSYNMKCIKCANAKYNWFKFVISAFVPLTFFFFLILVFGVKAYSPQLDAFIIVAQMISTPANIRIVMEWLNSKVYMHPFYNYSIFVLFTIYGIWNLDFFRTLLPDNCLKINTLQVLALDYIIALYPLFLIVFTYILVDLYDRRLWPLVWIWKPFKKCLKSITDTVNIKSSILNAFGTFLLLSYGKFLTVSFDLLVYTRAYTPNGKVGSYVLFYDATIEYFGRDHLPYAILAIVITLLFNILPLLFALLHPLRCFRGCTAKWPALRICLDSYQGYYKDGTEGTRDCRFFSGLYLLIRITLFVVYALFREEFYSIAPIFLLCLVMLIVMIRPFKKQFGIYNSIHVLLILDLTMLLSTVTCLNTAFVQASSVTFSIILSTVACILPLFYITSLVIKWMRSQSLFQKCFKKCFDHCQLWHTKDHDQPQDSDFSESLPHRMEHDEPLLTNNTNVNLSQYGTVEHTDKTAY